MHSPYREPAQLPKYPFLNPPLIEPPTYGRTYGCRCCSFGEHTIQYGIQSNYKREIEYAWCLNCLMHYRKILHTFDFYCNIITLNYHGGRQELAGLGRMVYFESQNDIAILQHVIHSYHIPLIKLANASCFAAIDRDNTRWLKEKQLPMKIFPSKVSSIITKLKRMLGLK